MAQASLDGKAGGKPRPNHHIYLQVLRKMTPEQRLLKAFELSELGKQLFRHGLRQRFPDLTEEEFHQLVLESLENATTGIIGSCASDFSRWLTLFLLS